MKKNVLFTKSLAVFTAAALFCSSPAFVMAEESASAESTDGESYDDGSSDSGDSSDSDESSDSGDSSDSDESSDSGDSDESSDSEDSSDSDESSVSIVVGDLYDDSVQVTSLTDKESAKLSSDTAKSLGISRKGDKVKLTSDDKPYLAIGVDLSVNQRKDVLGLMGINVDDLANYKVSAVDSNDEHDYLDAYLSDDAIGTFAIASAALVKTEEGSGLKVATYNVKDYTAGMYKNALATAGIMDANIIIAAPEKISGTAALVDIFKAYEDMTGIEIDQALTSSAIYELLATKKIEAKVKDVESEVMEGIIASLKSQISSGDLSEDELELAVEEAGKTYGVTFDEEVTGKLVKLLKNLEGQDLKWDVISTQASHMEKAISEYSMENQNFFQKIVIHISNFFKNLFRR